MVENNNNRNNNIKKKKVAGRNLFFWFLHFGASCSELFHQPGNGSLGLFCRACYYYLNQYLKLLPLLLLCSQQLKNWLMDKIELNWRNFNLMPPEMEYWTFSTPSSLFSRLTNRLVILENGTRFTLHWMFFFVVELHWGGSSVLFECVISSQKKGKCFKESPRESLNKRPHVKPRAFPSLLDHHLLHLLLHLLLLHRKTFDVVF